MMPIIHFKVPTESVESITRAIGVQAESFNFLRVWEEVVLPWVLEFNDEQFNTDGAHGGGGKWADYSGEPLYAAYKLAIVGHLDLLRWEKGGTYEMLYPAATSEGAAHQTIERGEDRFLFSIDVPHAPDLGADTEGPFGEPSPARPLMIYTGEQRRGLFRDISRNIRDHEGLPRGGSGGGKVHL